MSSKSPISLLNFFVFNATYGPNEGEEHKKILYYWPPDTNLDVQIKQVGLCEAVIKFTSSFDPIKPCEAIHTQKTRQLFLQPETDFWVILTVNVPFVQKTKDGQVYVEYHADDVQDNVFQAVLKQAYNMFKLFMGSFEFILKDKAGIRCLKQRLEHFFSRYLQTLKLSNADVLDVFQGIYFLPLDKNNFLKIQFFINQLEAMFPQIKYVAFLYNDQLVWSGLEQDDMQIMYKYLTTSLFPAYQEKELQTGSELLTRNSQGSAASPHYGKFVTGPTNVNDASSSGKVPRIFINTDTASEECHLLVYRALNASVCLVVNASFQVTFDFYKKLDNFLGPHLSALASEVGDHYSKRSSGGLNEAQFKYIYFNHMNLAQKSTIHVDAKRTGNVSVPADVMKLLGDLNADLSRMTHSGEIIVKTLSDCWVVGKFSDQREFYVVINQKNANLIEVNEELKKLCSTHFNNIFISD